MTKAILVAQFLRARAWWRLDSAGASALHVARSVVSLLDAAGYAEGLPDDDPRITALDAAGCFAAGIFDPGSAGWDIVRKWQLAAKASAGPEDLLAQLAQAASYDGPAASYDGPAASHHGPAASHHGPAASHHGPAASHHGPAASHRGPAANHDGPAAVLASVGRHAGPGPQAIAIPRQAGPRDDRVPGNAAGPWSWNPT
ncbi:MAG: hypothetical protein ACRDOA_11510 [Streptosporangiaceae bacterium]